MRITRRVSKATGATRYVARVSFQDNGTQREYAKTFRTVADARRWLRHQEAARDGGTFAKPSRKGVNEWLDLYLRSANVKPRTRADYLSVARRYIRPAFGHLRLAALTTPMIRAWLSDLSGRGLAPDTVAAAHRVLRQACAVAVTDGLIPANPAAVRGLAPRQERRERPILDGGQMHALWAVTRDADPLHALWALALTSGARVGELLALTWADVRLDAGEMEIRRTLERLPGQGWRLTEPKTERSRRTLPLLPVAVEALRWHRTRQEAARTVAGAGYRDYDSGGFVFAGPTGAPLRGDTVNKQWHRALDRAGLPPLRLHDARHSAATFWLVDADVPLRVVSDLLGHSTVKLLADRYSHVLPAHLRQSAAAVAARLAKHGQNTDSGSRAAT